MKVTVDLPDELVRDPATAQRDLLEAALIGAYMEGRITSRALGKQLGLDVWQTEEFLERKRVPLNYTEEDLERDRSAHPRAA
jgi:predicted HTH domain antitoxin